MLLAPQLECKVGNVLCLPPPAVHAEVLLLEDQGHKVADHWRAEPRGLNGARLPVHLVPHHALDGVVRALAKVYRDNVLSGCVCVGVVRAGLQE